jgi:hypothetical protein
MLPDLGAGDGETDDGHVLGGYVQNLHGIEHGSLRRVGKNCHDEER